MEVSKDFMLPENRGYNGLKSVVGNLKIAIN